MALEQAAEFRPPTPSRPASVSTPASSSSRAPSAISARARLTVLALPRQEAKSGAISGRHRRQGRKPASWAAAAEAKKRQFSKRGVRAGQTGRQ